MEKEDKFKVVSEEYNKDKEQVQENERLKLSLKQSAKGDWYCGEIRVRANTIEEISVGIDELKKIAEKQINNL